MVFPYQSKVSLKHKRPMRLKLSLSYGVGWLLELQEELNCEINDPYLEKVKHIVPDDVFFNRN